MYRGLKVIAMAPVLDEEQKIALVVRRIPLDIVDEMLVIDDGSTDRSAEVARREGARVISMGHVAGVGAALRAGYSEALARGYDVAVVMAGNNKDSPEEIARLLDPIAEGCADFVQGSRWMAGGRVVSMPLFRRVTTIAYSALFTLVAGRLITDGTNGFRAFRTALPKTIDLRQRWLDTYELEPYLYYHAIKQGYRVAEVPVTKRYPPSGTGYTKMKPFRDWWRILKPLVLLGLRIRR